MGEIILLPGHWYLVEITRDGKQITTIVRFSGVDKDDHRIFEGYEALGVAEYMHVIREVQNG